jgi:hypothetical protein
MLILVPRTYTAARSLRTVGRKPFRASAPTANVHPPRRHSMVTKLNKKDHRRTDVPLDRLGQGLRASRSGRPVWAHSPRPRPKAPAPSRRWSRRAPPCSARPRPPPRSESPRPPAACRTWPPTSRPRPPATGTSWRTSSRNASPRPQQAGCAVGQGCQRTDHPHRRTQRSACRSSLAPELPKARRSARPAQLRQSRRTQGPPPARPLRHRSKAPPQRQATGRQEAQPPPSRRPTQEGP